MEVMSVRLLGQISCASFPVLSPFFGREGIWILPESFHDVENDLSTKMS